MRHRGDRPPRAATAAAVVLVAWVGGAPSAAGGGPAPSAGRATPDATAGDQAGCGPLTGGEAFARLARGAPLAMSYAFTGDPDRDFASLMVRHGLVAMDMARAGLRCGRDPELRRLAEETIATREREADLLHRFIANRGLDGRPASPRSGR